MFFTSSLPLSLARDGGRLWRLFKLYWAIARCVWDLASVALWPVGLVRGTRGAWKKSESCENESTTNNTRLAAAYCWQLNELNYWYRTGPLNLCCVPREENEIDMYVCPCAWKNHKIHIDPSERVHWPLKKNQQISHIHRKIDWMTLQYCAFVPFPLGCSISHRKWFCAIFGHFFRTHRSVHSTAFEFKYCLADSKYTEWIF